MEEPITDTETTSEAPTSFNPIDGDADSTLTVDIVHHNGTAVVTDFERIREIDAAGGCIRVWYDEDDYETFYGGTITQVNP